MDDDVNDHRGVRIWDRFLTERDRAHIARGWCKTSPFGIGPNAALVVIDNTREVAGDGPEELLDAMGASRTTCGAEGWEALQRTKELLRVARARGVFVVHTTLKQLIPTGVNARFGRIGGDAYDFHPDSLPLPGELVIEKAHASAFHGTALSGQLVSRGIGSVVVCGNSTSGCVRASVVDAAACGRTRSTSSTWT
jgi:nicotinamidase-related amidase